LHRLDRPALPEAEPELVEAPTEPEERRPQESKPLPVEPEPPLFQPTWTEPFLRTNGEDRKYGNLVGMQTYMHLTDFARMEVYEKRIRELLQKGKSSNIFDRKTIVIFPEHIGTGLFLLEEKAPAFETNSLEDLASYLQKKYSEELPQFPPHPQAKKPIWDSLLRRKSAKMAEAYQSVFSKLAKEFNVPIFAGSILLPGPKLVRGSLQVDTKAPLYNVAVVFGTDGRPMEPLVKKTVLSTWEESLAEPGDPNQNRVRVVPGWKVGIFVGEEVFSETLYDKLKGRPMDGIVACGFSAPSQSAKDLQRYITEPMASAEEKEIWKMQGIFRFVKKTRAQDIVQVFSGGSLWGNATKIPSFNVRDFQFWDGASSDQKPQILNLYF